MPTRKKARSKSCRRKRCRKKGGGISVSEWIASLNNYSKYSTTFEYTEWDQMYRYTANNLIEMGIPKNEVNGLIALRDEKYAQKNDTISPLLWVKNLGKFSKFYDIFRYTDWDQMYRYKANNLIEMGVTPQAAIPLYDMIQRHDNNPKKKEYEINKEAEVKKTRESINRRLKVLGLTQT